MAQFSRENLYNPATTRKPLIYLFPENAQFYKLLFTKEIGRGQNIDNVFNGRRQIASDII